MEPIDYFSPEVDALLASCSPLSPQQAALKLHKTHPRLAAFVALQLDAKQNFKHKFPQLLEKNWRFPSRQALEQASSEPLAVHKARQISGNRALDLTAGSGIDSYFFSQNFNEVTAVERHEHLAHFLKQNALKHAPNLQVEQGNGLDWIQAGPWDFIYADPDRRVEGKRVHGLDQAEPNLLPWLDALLEKSPVVWIKASPLLDVQAAWKIHPNLTEIEILGHQGECKEVLLKFTQVVGPRRVVVSLLERTHAKFAFEPEEILPSAHFPVAGDLLLDPHPALKKSGLWSQLTKHTGWKLSNKSTPLFFSSEPQEQQPGKVYRIHQVLRANEIKKLKLKQANISVRNAQPDAPSLHKQWKISGGGSTHLYWCTLSDGSMHGLLCEPFSTE